MRTRISPTAILSASLLVGLALAVLATSVAVRQPWLGLELVAKSDTAEVRVEGIDAGGPTTGIAIGNVLVSLEGENGETFELAAQDLVDEPDTFETYVQMGAFFARQDRLAAILRQQSIGLAIRAEGSELIRHTVSPARHRQVTDLPADFWVQIFVGLGGFVIGAWVWSLRDTLSTRLFAVVGACILAFTFAAAIYSTRELALGGTLFRTLSAINHAGALSFGVAMIALFLSYPRPIVPPRYLLVLPVVFGSWWLADTTWLLSGPPAGSHLPTLIEMVGILVCAGLQYWKTGGDPRARAALRWFGLAAAVGAGAFVLTIIAPNLVGANPALSQGYAFLFFLLIYAGLALGVARFRLFELDEWAFRVLFYLVGVFMLVILDVVLIFLLSVDRVPALSLSLIAVAFLYLPFRDTLARRFKGRRAITPESQFRQVVDVALTPPGKNQKAGWQQLLQSIFDPLRIEPREPTAVATLDEDGLALAVPGTDSLPSLRLEYADGGRRLFSSRDAATAADLATMLTYAIESRRSYENGVSEERERIARDMHDNIGVQLLGALHSRETGRKDAMIREALADLRDIINNASRPGLSFEETLADLRVECAEHLSSASVSLDWTVEPGDAPVLTPNAAHALRSVVREATSNVIKHAGATTMRIAIRHREGSISVLIEDDGKGVDLANDPAGNGLANMRARMAGLRGTFEIIGDGSGTRLAARFPASDARVDA